MHCLYLKYRSSFSKSDIQSCNNSALGLKDHLTLVATKREGLSNTWLVITEATLILIGSVLQFSSLHRWVCKKEEMRVKGMWGRSEKWHTLLAVAHVYITLKQPRHSRLVWTYQVCFVHTTQPQGNIIQQEKQNSCYKSVWKSPELCMNTIWEMSVAESTVAGTVPTSLTKAAWEVAADWRLFTPEGPKPVSCD